MLAKTWRARNRPRTSVQWQVLRSEESLDGIERQRICPIVDTVDHDASTLTFEGNNRALVELAIDRFVQPRAIRTERQNVALGERKDGEQTNSWHSERPCRNASDQDQERNHDRDDRGCSEYPPLLRTHQRHAKPHCERAIVGKFVLLFQQVEQELMALAKCWSLRAFDHTIHMVYFGKIAGLLDDDLTERTVCQDAVSD